MTNSRLTAPLKRINAWLAVAIVLTIALGACVYFRIDLANKLDVISPTPYKTARQNYMLATSDTLSCVFLGTYKDAVAAIDENGNEIWASDVSGAVEGMKYDASREQLIVGSQGRYLYIFNAADGSLVRETSVPGRINDIDVDEASGLILVVGQKNSAKGFLSIYSMEAEEPVLSLSTRVIESCAFSPDGKYIYYGDARATVYKLDIDGNELASAKLDKGIKAIDLASATGDVVAISDSAMVCLYDSDLNLVSQTRLVGEGRAVAITADGEMIGAGTREGDFYILNRDVQTQFSTRLASAVAQIVINGENSYVVPWSESLYTLDVSSASEFANYTALHNLMGYMLIALPIVAFLAFVLAFGKSRALFYAFFRSLARHKTAYILLLPSFALIILFNYVPVVQAFYYAFTDWNMASTTMRDVKFIGFDNFAKMISEGYFLLGVKNMLVIMVFNFLKLLVPLIVAELVFANRSDRGRYWYRFLLVLPMVVPGVVSTLMWKQIYDPSTGLINKFFELIGHADWARSWLGREDTALGAIIFMGFPWVNSFAFLVFYGGLINIPQDLFEAAKVDGSNPVWNLTRIHLPLITPQIKMILILTFISSIQDYGSVLLLTDGGPGYVTYVPGFELYMNATRLGQYGYACSLGLVMFVAILAGTIANLKIKTEDALG